MPSDIWLFFSSLFMVSSLRLLMIWSTYHVQNWRILFPTISPACWQFLIWISPPILGEHLGAWDAFVRRPNTYPFLCYVFFFAVLHTHFLCWHMMKWVSPVLLSDCFSGYQPAFLYWQTWTSTLMTCMSKIIYLDVYSFYSGCTEYMWIKSFN